METFLPDYGLFVFGSGSDCIYPLVHSTHYTNIMEFGKSNLQSEPRINLGMEQS